VIELMVELMVEPIIVLTIALTIVLTIEPDGPGRAGYCQRAVV
jgi:hypothetical protein